MGSSAPALVLLSGRAGRREGLKAALPNGLAPALRSLQEAVGSDIFPRADVSLSVICYRDPTAGKSFADELAAAAAAAAAPAGEPLACRSLFGARQ
jgi:hypothetical protein